MASFALVHKNVGWIVVLFAMGFAAYVALCRYEPSIPEVWRQIHRGQPRTEVLALLPDASTDLYDMKQCDQAWRVSKSLIFGRISQFLLVHYGRDARVERLQVRTITSRFRLFRNQTNINHDA